MGVKIVAVGGDANRTYGGITLRVVGVPANH